MDQRVKAFIVLGTISMIIYTIYLMTSSGENMLNASAGRDPTKQKLMVVDQDSGEISFVQKSLQVINQDRSAEDQTIKDALVLLLGENLQGDTSGFIKELKNDVVKKTYVDTELAKKQVKGNYQAAGNYIASGNFVALARNGDNGCDGKGCRAVTGFKQKGRSHGQEDAGWKEADASFNHGKNSTMRIWKN